jgi:hypothetical protein
MSEPVVIYVGTWSSRCGACNKDAIPYDIAHETVCGYDQHEGCGAVFTHVFSTYPNLEESVKRMRPDLIYGVPSATTKN